MTYTQEQLVAIQEDYQRNARINLEDALREVLNSPEYSGLSNESKSDVLLDWRTKGNTTRSVD